MRTAYDHYLLNSYEQLRWGRLLELLLAVHYLNIKTKKGLALSSESLSAALSVVPIPSTLYTGTLDKWTIAVGGICRQGCLTGCGGAGQRQQHQGSSTCGRHRDQLATDPPACGTGLYRERFLRAPAADSVSTVRSSVRVCTVHTSTTETSAQGRL